MKTRSFLWLLLWVTFLVPESEAGFIPRSQNHKAQEAEDSRVSRPARCGKFLLRACRALPRYARTIVQSCVQCITTDDMEDSAEEKSSSLCPPEHRPCESKTPEDMAVDYMKGCSVRELLEHAKRLQNNGMHHLASELLGRGVQNLAEAGDRAPGEWKAAIVEILERCNSSLLKTGCCERKVFEAMANCVTMRPLEQWLDDRLELMVTVIAMRYGTKRPRLLISTAGSVTSWMAWL